MNIGLDIWHMFN